MLKVPPQLFKRAILIFGFFTLLSHLAKASDYQRGQAFLPPTSGLQILDNGKIQVDQKKWDRETELGGTEIFSYKRTSADPKQLEDKAVIVRNGAELASIASYELGRKSHPGEISSSIEFSNGQIASVTQCEDKIKPGRSCLTVNSPLCSALERKQPISNEVMGKLERTEVHALALILTLRGSDHQMENLASTGNRFGIRSKNQTTKGQIGMDDARKTLRHLCQISGLSPSLD
jgi:hypothetical protein